MNHKKLSRDSFIYFWDSAAALIVCLFYSLVIWKQPGKLVILRRLLVLSIFSFHVSHICSSPAQVTAMQYVKQQCVRVRGCVC